ncbi:hypothetical protein GCM10027053_12270 [Intrasporangium mesophilum]
MNDEDVIQLLSRVTAPEFTPVSPDRALAAAVRRKRMRAGGIVGAVACAAFVAAGVAVVRPFAPVEAVPAGSVPPAGASVTEVADAYMRALTAEQCETIRALAVPTTPTWCGDPRLVSYRRDGELRTLPGPPGGQQQTCVPYTIETTASSDHSFDAGSRPWSLCFMHTAHGWRLSDQGF